VTIGGIGKKTRKKNIISWGNPQTTPGRERNTTSMRDLGFIFGGVNFQRKVSERFV